MQAGRRHWTAWSLALEAVVSGASRSGNSQDVVGLGVGAGRAFARIEDADAYGGLDFLAGDALLAEFDSDKGEFWLKEDAHSRAPAMLPWRLTGEQKNIRHAKPNEYVVVRAVKQGAGMSREHVALRGGALVAHHLTPRPPVNSSLVYDPGEGDDDERNAGLHGLMRVRRFARSFCGKYAEKEDGPFWALLLNFAKSTGDNSGYGAAHFGKNEALLSYHGGGPLRDSDADHEVAFGEAPIQQGALDVFRHLWGSEGTLFSPAEFQNQPWRDGSEGPFIKRVHWREDFDATHTNHCGKRVRGMKKWMTYADKESLPTYPMRRPRDPRDPPTDDPPGTPRWPVRLPSDWSPYPPFGMAHLPYTPEPTNTGPAEEEQPSLRGMSAPDIPEGPRGDGGVTDEPDVDVATLTPAEQIRRERDQFWMVHYGFTEKQFYSEPRLIHHVYVPQYERATRGNGPTKWPAKLRNPALLFEDPDTGKIVARQAAHGPGGEVVMPGMLGRWHALREQWGKHVPVDTPESSFVLLNQRVLDEGGIDHDVVTRFGLGSRALLSPHTASGAEHKLTYGGAGGRTLPDYEITPKDDTAAEASTSHAALKINYDLAPMAEMTLGASIDIDAGDNVECGNATLVRVTSGTTLTGLVAPTPSRRRALWLVNHTGVTLTIAHDSVASSASNRIYCPASAALTVSNRAGVMFVYDTALSRWTIIDDAAGVGGGTGDVVGPSIATDNAATRFDGTTGKLVQNSDLVIEDLASNVVEVRVPSVGSGTANALLVRGGSHTAAASVAGNLRLRGGSANISGGQGGDVVVESANGGADLAGLLDVSAAMKLRVTRVTGATTLAVRTHLAVMADTDGGGFTLTMPTTPENGSVLIIKNSGTNTLTLSTTIDGVSSLTSGQAILIQYQTTEGWRIMASHGFSTGGGGSGLSEFEVRRRVLYLF